MNYPRKPVLQGHYCSQSLSTSRLAVHRKLQAGGRGRGFGLGEEPCPSKQDGYNSLRPQGAAIDLSVGTANKTSVDVAKGKKKHLTILCNKKSDRK